MQLLTLRDVRNHIVGTVSFALWGLLILAVAAPLERTTQYGAQVKFENGKVVELTLRSVGFVHGKAARMINVWRTNLQGTTS